MTTNSRKYGLLATALAGFCVVRRPPTRSRRPHPRRTTPSPTRAKPTRRISRKNSENPIGNLTILPFENYTNFDFGPHNGTQNMLEFEPVVPFHINTDWNLITRAVIPAVWNPSLLPGASVPQAIAPTDFSAFFSPSQSGQRLDSGASVRSCRSRRKPARRRLQRLGPGPDRRGRPYRGDMIVAGVLVNNVWSFGGTSGPTAPDMRSYSWSRSSTIISARAGSSAPRRS